MSIHHDSELRAFHFAARLGSMSLAAKHMQLSQPTISAHICKLERLYGLELFFRKGRQLVLTEFGLTLSEVTNRMYEAETEALSLLEQGKLSYRGTLRVCAVGPFNVMPIIRRFRDENPDIHVSLVLGDSAQITEQVTNYRCDVGILVHAVNDPKIDCLPYRKQPLVVFSSAKHPLANQKKCTVQDLHNKNFVLREHGSSTRRVFLETMARKGISIRCNLEIGSRESLHEAVALDLGLGVVSAMAYRPDDRTAVLPINEPSLHTHVHIISRMDRSASRLISRFRSVAIALQNDFLS
jgi:LysR family transcriptional regulator, low CO2-responsive transcriptional regulator